MKKTVRHTYRRTILFSWRPHGVPVGARFYRHSERNAPYGRILGRAGVFCFVYAPGRTCHPAQGYSAHQLDRLADQHGRRLSPVERSCPAYLCNGAFHGWCDDAVGRRPLPPFRELWPCPPRSACRRIGGCIFYARSAS